MKAIIAGAGIGGLCAAIALARRGWQVVIVEQAPEFIEIGAGLQISPNGAKVLRALGLLEAVEQVSFAPERIEMRFGKSGATVFTIPLREAAVLRWGAPYLHVHRADLHRVLTQAAAALPITILNGRVLTSYATRPNGVDGLLAGGETVAADLLVGADGWRSTVRTQMLGPEAPRFTGCAAWRAVVPIEALGAHALPPTACVWVGEGKHAVTYRLRGGTLANFVGVVEQDAWRNESWIEEGSREDALKAFTDWHPVVRTMIEKAGSLYRWALLDRDPLPRWTDGPVALLGDACHPMLPFLAQGAVMAIEDAYVLARCVSGGETVSHGVMDYEAQRKPRTTRVQKAARANTGIFHRRTSWSKLTTYGPMWLGARIAPRAVHARQDWLYGADVTAG